MRVLKPEEIRQPRSALVIKPPKPEDWEMKLGAEERPDINKKGDWRDAITEEELQRNKHFDNWSCVTFALFNKVQAIINHKHSIITDWSKRASAVQNGTVPKIGNSISAPCEHLRKKGAWLESDYPTMTPDMTEAEYFSLKVDPEKEAFSKDWAYTHENVPRKDRNISTVENLRKASRKSPVMVSIEGGYTFDREGRIVWGGSRISHEVLIVHMSEKTAYAVDSENEKGLLPIAIDYPFHWAKIGFVNKITPTPFEVNRDELHKAYRNILVRNNDSGKIYIVDSSLIPHHIEKPEVFKEFFGEDAWRKQIWQNSDTKSMSHLLIREGDPITRSNTNLIQSILESIKNFGKTKI